MYLKEVGIIAAVFFGLLSYNLYTPLPEGITEPWKVRTMLAFTKVLHNVASFTEFVGYSSKINAIRKLIHITLPSAPKDPMLEVTDDTIAGVKVRFYRPKTESKNLPGLIYLHGGGWSFLSIDTYDLLTATLAKKSGIVVVSVEYRLAPEHLFPIPFNDCVNVVVDILRNADKMGILKDRIAIAGDSAGGNLAAAVSQRLSSETVLPRLKFQVLIYPALQAFDFSTPSFINYSTTTPYLLTKKSMVAYWLNYYQGHSGNIDAFMVNNHTSPLLKQSEYASMVSHQLLPKAHQDVIKTPPNLNYGNKTLSDEFEKTLLNPFYSPLMSINLEKIQKTYMLTAEFDVLRDDGFMYVKRLENVGVNVTHAHYTEGFHGFLSLKEFDLYDQAVNHLVDYIKKNI